MTSSAASHRPSRAAEGAGVPRPAEAWSCGRVVAERTGLAVAVSSGILGGLGSSSPRSTRISERSRERRNPSGGREVRPCGIHHAEAEVLARNGGEDRGGHPWWRRRKGCSLARGGVSEENRCAMRDGEGKRSRPDDSWLPAPWKTTGCGLQPHVQWASKGRGGLAQGSLPRGFWT